MQTVPEGSLISLESLPEAYIRLDSEFRCMFVNQEAQVLLGNNWAKLLGNRLWDVYPENAGTPLHEGCCRAMAKRTVFTFDLYEKSRNGRYAITAMSDSSDGILVRLSNLTDQESAEPEKQQTNSQSRLQGIARNLPGFVYQTYVRGDGEWGVYFADKRACDIFGIEPEPLETVFKRLPHVSHQKTKSDSSLQFENRPVPRKTGSSKDDSSSPLAKRGISSVSPGQGGQAMRLCTTE